jgi:hypothetical protein
VDQIIALTNQPGQTLSVSLTVDGDPLTLQMRFRYNDLAKYWTMAVMDRTGAPLVDSVPMISSDYPAANLLQQHAYLGIGSAYVINVSGSAAEYPSDSMLGSDFVLLWGDTPLV